MLTVSTQIVPEDNLHTFEQLLKSVTFADELLIFNMERKDPEFMQLTHQYRAQAINVKRPLVVEVIRARQIKESHGDWVLVMDFDEVVTTSLREEIKTIMTSSGACSAYAIGRDNFSLGYPLHHGGWERDYVVRLVHRADFVDWPTNIHSTPVVKGCIVKTMHAMEHHKDESLTQMVAKTNRYSAVEAQLFFDGGLPPVTPITFFRKPFMEFFRRYILKRGFLDGRIGLLQSLYQSYSVFITYAKLYELQMQNSKNN